MRISSTVILVKSETRLSRYTNLHYKCIIIYKNNVC